MIEAMTIIVNTDQYQVDPAQVFERDMKGTPYFDQGNIWLALAKLGVRLYHCVPRHPDHPPRANKKPKYVIEGFAHWGPVLSQFVIDELQHVMASRFGFGKPPSKAYFRQQLEVVARGNSLEQTGRILVEDRWGRLTVDVLRAGS